MFGFINRWWKDRINRQVERDMRTATTYAQMLRRTKEEQEELRARREREPESADMLSEAIANNEKAMRIQRAELARFAALVGISLEIAEAL